jgi:holo-[acyl-carrier protein] synthase
MIIGIGIDLVENSRIEKLFKRFGKRFLNRIFSEEEISYSLSKRRAFEHLAARFAAKEAFFKASGRRYSFKEIVVGTDPLGKPFFSKLPFSIKAHLSLSHTENLSIAVVVIEKGSHVPSYLDLDLHQSL